MMAPRFSGLGASEAAAVAFRCLLGLGIGGESSTMGLEEDPGVLVA